MPSGSGCIKVLLPKKSRKTGVKGSVGGRVGVKNGTKIQGEGVGLVMQECIKGTGLGQCLLGTVGCRVNHKANGSEKVDLAGGAATSSKVPRFGLIPRQALVAYAGRLELGIERHTYKVYNAQSKNFNEVNESLDWVLERLSHTIDHALQAIAELTGQVPSTGEDHSGAIMFGGGVLACSVPYRKLKGYPNSDGGTDDR